VTQASSLIPGVALRLEETVPSGQDLAFDRGEIDIGFTRPPSADRSSSYESRLLFREPLVVPFPKTRKVKAKRIRIADLAGERIVTFQRASSPDCRQLAEEGTFGCAEAVS